MESVSVRLSRHICGTATRHRADRVATADPGEGPRFFECDCSRFFFRLVLQSSHRFILFPHTRRDIMATNGVNGTHKEGTYALPQSHRDVRYDLPPHVVTQLLTRISSWRSRSSRQTQPLLRSWRKRSNARGNPSSSSPRRTSHPAPSLTPLDRL